MEISEAMNIAESFDGIGTVTAARQFGSGHINSTYQVETTEGKFTLQRLNTTVFREPEKVMHNMSSVTAFLRESISRRGGKDKTIELVKAADGTYLHRDSQGNFWRMYHFIDDVISLNLPDSPESFRQSGRAFGQFAADLADFPADTLYETIPNFHNTPARICHFKDMLEKNPAGRKAGVEEEIAQVLSRQEKAGRLMDMLNSGILPLRVTHNDTKLNNVLLDAETREPVAVIDLDTIMPGLAAWDFGDSIRFGANTAVEDERDTSKISFSLPMFIAFTEGYLEKVGSMFDLEEIRSLPLGAWTMTYENALRFLDDYLDGDNYYHTDYPEHNLIRCRDQLALISDMERHMDEMQEIIDKVCKKIGRC